MRSQVLILLGALTLCLALSFVLSAAAAAEDSNSIANEEGRASVEVPKIFDFERFKTVFRRKYGSFVEELARRKIFLGRAFRAFLSFIGYKHRRQDKYLKISEMSDWTEAEHKSILRKRPLAALGKVPVLANPEETLAQLAETPVAEMDDVKAGLAELSKTRNSNLNKNRKKREAEESSEVLSLTIDDLFGEPDDEEEVIPDVESNNPDYQVPELASFGSEDDSSNTEMEPETSGIISNLPGASYVSSLMKKAWMNSFFEEDVAVYSTKSGKTSDVKIDHRECLSSPKSQGKCGSCYIFSTTALYEWQYCHESGDKTAFSEQYPLDCGERSGLKGCNGGFETGVAEFFGKYGVELKHHYPYRKKSEICPYDPDTSSKVMGYIKLTQKDGAMVGIKHNYVGRYLKQAPLAMGLGVPKDFSDYGGGVDDGATCDEENGHSMLLVGSGREDGKDYWLFRNSYGASWGLKGHYKLNKNATNCLLDDGMGFFLNPEEKGGKIFKLSGNKRYDKHYVKARYNDIKNHNYIEPNPFNIPEDDDNNNLVTAPSR